MRFWDANRRSFAARDAPRLNNLELMTRRAEWAAFPSIRAKVIWSAGDRKRCRSAGSRLAAGHPGHRCPVDIQTMWNRGFNNSGNPVVTCSGDGVSLRRA
jgi:hypothetical protein